MNIIVDGLNIAFRSHYVYDVQQGLKTSDGVPTGMVYGFVKTILKWKKKYPKHRIIVAWDCPTAKAKRQEISPDYKANRDRHFEEVEVPGSYDIGRGELSNEKDVPEDPESFEDTEIVEDSDPIEKDNDFDETEPKEQIEEPSEDQDESDTVVEEEVKVESGEVIDIFSLQIEFLNNFLTSLGIDQIKAEGYEADDLIGTLVRGPLKDEKNIILSSDHDMMQLVSWSTVLITPSGKAYDPEKVKEKYGVRPENLLTFRVFDGDSSDNMPGLPYFRRKVIARIVKENEGNLKSIYKSDIENLTAKETEKLSSFEDQAQINLDVMRLRTVEDYNYIDGNWSKDEVEGMCDILEFKSLRSELLTINNTNQGFLRFTDESLLHTTD